MHNRVKSSRVVTIWCYVWPLNSPDRDDHPLKASYPNCRETAFTFESTDESHFQDLFKCLENSFHNLNLDGNIYKFGAFTGIASPVLSSYFLALKALVNGKIRDGNLVHETTFVAACNVIRLP